MRAKKTIDKTQAATVMAHRKPLPSLGARVTPATHNATQVPITAAFVALYSLLCLANFQWHQVRATRAAPETVQHHSKAASNSMRPLGRPLAVELGQSESALFDPLVMDPGSLYSANTATRGGTTSRRKRSPSMVSAQAESAKYVDACQSKMEVLTPYYATNSKGKLRTVVNTELMQQAIQIETCQQQRLVACDL